MGNGAEFATLAACVSTLTGFVLARLHWSPLGAKVAAFSQQLSRLVLDPQINVGSEMLIFMFAGLGTAWGLTAAGVLVSGGGIWLQC